MKISNDFKAMAEDWKYRHVLHRDVKDFTSGAISRVRLSQLYSEGNGPRTFKIGNKLASDKYEFVEWLENYTKNLKRY
jgi:hypothetical protein